MGNRVIQVKVLKIKRRRMKLQGKFTSHAISADRHSISLSKQLINVGLRVPGRAIPKPAYTPDQINEFFRPRDVDTRLDEIPKTLGLLIGHEEARLLGAQLSDEQDLRMQNCILKTATMRVFCFFNISMSDVYLVRIRLNPFTVQRSVCNYPNAGAANKSAAMGNVVWRKPTRHIVSTD